VHFRILCNVSGSGKTRLLFEGLCAHWGFYLVAGRSIDGVGAPDLSDAIGSMKEYGGWVSNIFENDKPTDQVKWANDNNDTIAWHVLSKVILARWVMLYAFIEVAKGLHLSNVKRDWLLFQVHHHRDAKTGQNPFKTIGLTVIKAARPDTLRDLTAEYSGKVFKMINPESFFYVIDEAQVAGEVYLGAFADGQGSIPRPVLRPIIRHMEMTSNCGVIVSGTGFSLKLFEDAMASGVGKDRTNWDVQYNTGDFSDQEVQSAYVSRFLPPSFLSSASGVHFETRIYRWLRGRYVVTKVSGSQLNHLLQTPFYSPLPGRDIKGALV